VVEIAFPIWNSEKANMLTLLRVDQWEQTRDTLHQAAQVLSAVRVGSVPPLPNALRHSLTVTSYGVRTTPLAWGGELRLKFTGTLEYVEQQEVRWQLALEQYTQTTLLEEVLRRLREQGQSVVPYTAAIQQTTPLLLNRESGRVLAYTLDRIYTGMARFRARLNGTLTPLVLWSHHFDVSFLYFGQGQDEQHDPHLNCGFALHSEGFAQPYFYLYAYPQPAGLSTITLPSPAYWYAEHWQGVVLDYAPLADSPMLEGVVEQKLSEIFEQMISYIRAK
jgi:hypothetical protein